MATSGKKKPNAKNKTAPKGGKKKPAAKKPAAKKKPERKTAQKPPAKAKSDPKPAPAPDTSKGIPTSETKILACQCGSTMFAVKNQTATSVALVCDKCGLRTSVKGSIATVRVKQQEIIYALENTVISPQPEDASGGPAAGEKVGDGTGPAGEEYITLRFRIMKGDQKKVVDKAMEAVRVQNCGDDKFREQTWQGHALEFLCADHLSGCSHDVLQIIDAMDASEEDAERIAKDAGKKPPTPRRIRDVRAKVRDKLAKKSGILPEDFFGSDDDRQMDLPTGDEDEEEQGYACPECDATVESDAKQCTNCGVDFLEDKPEVEQEPEGDTDTDAEEEKEFKPVPDSGRLLKAVVATLHEFLEEARGADVKKEELPMYEISDGAKPSEALVKKWTKGGGYLVRVLGDKRTVGPDDKRVEVCVWIAAEPRDLALDFGIEYDDATDDILGDGVVEVVELLPPDYDEIDPWNKPHFADRREKI